MDQIETGYAIRASDIIVVHAAALTALALFVRIACVTVAGL